MKRSILLATCALSILSSVSVHHLLCQQSDHHQQVLTTRLASIPKLYLIALPFIGLNIPLIIIGVTIGCYAAFGQHPVTEENRYFTYSCEYFREEDYLEDEDETANWSRQHSMSFTDIIEL